MFDIWNDIGVISWSLGLTNVQNTRNFLDMASTKTQTGHTLRGLRKAAGLTLADVADIADTAPAYLSKVESGALEPSPSYFWRVAQSITLAMAAAA